MDSVEVLISCPSRYKINRALIRETVTKIINDLGLRRPSEVSLSVVGDRKMRQLNRDYRRIDEPSSVLAFPLIKEGDQFYYPPTGQRYLGDLVISYPQLIKRATQQNVMVDDELVGLLEHGLRNLLGIVSR